MALDMKGYQLTIYDTFTDLVGGATGVPSGQTWRVVMLEVCNTHDEPEPFFLRWLDSSESGAARTLADFEIIPGIPYYPLETELVMKTGDRLQRIAVRWAQSELPDASMLPSPRMTELKLHSVEIA